MRSACARSPRSFDAPPRANKKPAEPVGVYRGDELIDNVLTTPPEAYLACMEAAATAAEAGPESGAQRAQDWRLRRIPAVLASPLEQASTACSLWTVMGEGQRFARHLERGGGYVPVRAWRHRGHRAIETAGRAERGAGSAGGGRAGASGPRLAPAPALIPKV